MKKFSKKQISDVIANKRRQNMKSDRYENIELTLQHQSVSLIKRYRS